MIKNDSESILSVVRRVVKNKQVSRWFHEWNVGRGGQVDSTKSWKVNSISIVFRTLRSVDYGP